MKNKKLIFPTALIMFGLFVTALYTVFLNTVTVPQIVTMEFPFSVTYEYNGKTVTAEDIFLCRYSSSDVYAGEHHYFWDGEIVGRKNKEHPTLIEVDDTGNGTLSIVTNLCAGYFMGDPQYADYYKSNNNAPYAAFFDESGAEYSKETPPFEFELTVTDFEFPTPVKNEFRFSHVTHIKGVSSLPMTVCALVFFLIALIFVKKEKDTVYDSYDHSSILFNFLVGFVALPFITLAASLTDLNGDGKDLIFQIIYCIPAITVFGLSSSVVLRRKGFKKGSILIQFFAPSVFVILLIIDFIRMFIHSVS